MIKAERFKLYEKLYFLELDRREKINSRLALPFGVIVATVGLLSFMLNSGEKPECQPYVALFWLLFVASAVALAFGAWFFRKAWFGDTDKLLPTASLIEDYYRELVTTYEKCDDHEKLVNSVFEEFLFNYFARCSSEYAINNDQRSYNIYRATVSLTVSVLLAFFAALPFFIGNQLCEESRNDQTGAASTSAAPATPQCEGGHAQTTATASSNTPNAVALIFGQVRGPASGGFVPYLGVIWDSPHGARYAIKFGIFAGFSSV